MRSPSPFLVNSIPGRLVRLLAAHTDRQRVYRACLGTLLLNLPWIDASYTDLENTL